MIKVFGHKSPDTDTVLSAIIYSWYLNQTGREAKPFVLGEVNGETKFVLEKFGVEVPDLLESVNKDDQIAIVDTSNNEELFENINETDIVSFVDHHKLAGNISTSKPLDITVRPYAATATVLYWLMDKENLTDSLPEDISKMIIACIISDTLLFRSPSTTEYDKDIAQKLAQATSVNLEELADEMFAAKSDLSGMSVREILKLDSKIYEVKGKKLRVSVVETTKPSNTLDQLEEIKADMVAFAKEEGNDDVLLFVIDILNEEATVIVATDSAKEIVSNAFEADWTKDNIAVLPGVLSRKKQIMPALEA